jgi:aminocarboxymuconate-semialdehyde decarboxylase
LLSYDTLTYDPMNMRLLIDRLGAERLIMGSDYPFPLREVPPGAVIDALDGLSHKERADLLGRNALRFLGREVLF